MILLVLVLAAVSVTLAVLLIRMRARYARVVDVEKERARVADERDKLAARIKKRRAAWKTEYEETVSELSQLNDQLVSTRDQVAMESFGLYEPIFDFEDPEDFKKKLKEIRAEQKDMLRGKTAAVCQTEWTVEGSKAKGRTMTNRQLRLMLRAFNGECDAAMGKVSLQQRWYARKAD